MTIPISRDIDLAAEYLRNGGLVVIPTETVYGLAAAIHQPQAIAQVFAIKKRPTTHPLIVHVADRSQLTAIVAEISPLATVLMEAFWPGPLTLILPKHPQLSVGITAGQSTVAVRMPAHPVAREVILKAETPVVAPSANYFEQLSPTSAKAASRALGEGVNLVLDGGDCQIGIESTIVRVQDGGWEILRPGMILATEIAAVAGSDPARLSGHVKVPGDHKRHYAPKRPAVLVAAANLAAYLKNAIQEHRCITCLTITDINLAFPQVKQWAMPNNASDYAQQLYAKLLLADSESDLIVVEAPPQDPAWLPILDRLSKATTLLC